MIGAQEATSISMNRPSYWLKDVDAGIDKPIWSETDGKPWKEHLPLSTIPMPFNQLGNGRRCVDCDTSYSLTSAEALSHMPQSAYLTRTGLHLCFLSRHTASRVVLLSATFSFNEDHVRHYAPG
jgi:hypothetical protein